MDYYQGKREWRCGPWVDMNEFTILIENPGAFADSHMTEKLRKEISRARKRVKHKPETKCKIGKSLKGKSKSANHRNRIASALNGRHHTETSRERMRVAASTKNIIFLSKP